jgi:hypothetical protein
VRCTWLYGLSWRKSVISGQSEFGQYQGILRPTYKTMHVLLLREIWNKIKRTAAGPDHMLQKCREDHRDKFSS